MIFIDFGLLRSPYCKISYLLADIVIRVKKFDNLHMTQCANIIVGFTANVGNVFIQRLQTFFPTFFYVLNIFFKFYLNVYYVCGGTAWNVVPCRFVVY